MNTQLDQLSSHLIRSLISTDIRFRQAKLAAGAKGKEAADLLGSVTPAFELTEALGMDDGFIELEIQAVLNGEINEGECADRIISHFEEFSINKMIDKQQYWDSSYEDMKELII